jgi:hypothetical protein
MLRVAATSAKWSAPNLVTGGDGVVRSAPRYAVDPDFRPTRSVDIGEVPWLDIVAGLANAQERADRVGDLLFATEAHTGVARIETH